MTQKVLDYSYARFTPAQVHNLGAVASLLSNSNTDTRLIPAADMPAASARVSSFPLVLGLTTVRYRHTATAPRS